MKQDTRKEEPKRTAKELLDDALFAADEMQSSMSDEKPALTDLKKERLVSSFLAHLEETVKVSEAQNKSLLELALATIRSERKPSNYKRLSSTADLRYEKPSSHRSYWTNKSVHEFVGAKPEGDVPITLITLKARELIWNYIENGGSCDPLDPFELARFMNVNVETNDAVPEARTLTMPSGQFVVQYNPRRPDVRTRFSICHELVHTLFPDCHLMTRNRSTHQRMAADEWQLESLCDVGAAELLMPVGTFTELAKRPVSLNPLLKMRDKLRVSTEAILLRLIKLTKIPSFVFSASRRRPAGNRFSIDYTVSSRTFQGHVPFGLGLPNDSVISNCSQFGFTDSGVEKWFPALGDLGVQCVGISPYPGVSYPRVMGVAVPSQHDNPTINSIHYVKGDATKPRSQTHRIVVQVVNDKAALWGGGFALVVRKKWPEVQRNFRDWATGGEGRLQLGSAHLSSVDDLTDVFSMICQHGYKATSKPSIRYSALRNCLEKLAVIARERNATVHMPRIGCGQARGNWEIVSEMISYFLCEQGIRVTVYDPPGAKVAEGEPTLFSLK